MVLKKQMLWHGGEAAEAATATGPNCRPDRVNGGVDGKLHPKVCSSPALNWDR